MNSSWNRLYSGIFTDYDGFMSVSHSPREQSAGA
jgi:hypothetical protein